MDPWIPFIGLFDRPPPSDRRRGRRDVRRSRRRPPRRPRAAAARLRRSIGHRPGVPPGHRQRARRRRRVRHVRPHARRSARACPVDDSPVAGWSSSVAAPSPTTRPTPSSRACPPRSSHPRPTGPCTAPRRSRTPSPCRPAGPRCDATSAASEAFTGPEGSARVAIRESPVTSTPEQLVDAVRPDTPTGVPPSPAPSCRPTSAPRPPSR